MIITIIFLIKITKIIAIKQNDYDGTQGPIANVRLFRMTLQNISSALKVIYPFKER